MREKPTMEAVIGASPLSGRNQAGRPISTGGGSEKDSR